MRRIVLTQTGAGASAVSPMNLNTSPFNVGFGVIVSGTVNFTVQHTFDDVFSPSFNAGTATWFPHPTIAGQVANADGNYAFPVTAIRLLVNSGGGTATLVLLQAGIQ
jgi:hypothetical protein